MRRILWSVTLGFVCAVSQFAQAPLPSPSQGSSSSSGGSGTVTAIATGCGLTGGPITTTGTIAETITTAAHNGSYAILAGDCGKSITTNTAAAWTIAQAGSAGFPAGWFVDINNVGSGSLTVTATTSTFYGGPTANISGSVLTVPANTSARVISDGANYQVLSGGGGATIPSTTNALKGDGAGNAAAVTGSATNCVLVNGTSAACDAPGQQAVSNTTPVTATNPSSAAALQQLTLTTGMLNVSTASGGVFTFNASGYYTVAALQTPTLTWVLNACTVSGCGSGTVRALVTVVTQAVVTAANNTWNARFTVSNTATGSSGTLLAQGCVNVELTASSDLGTTSCDSTTASSSAIDLTGVVYLQLTVLASSSNAGNSVVALKSSLEPAGAVGPTGPAGIQGITLVAGGQNATITTASISATIRAVRSCTIAGWSLAFLSGDSGTVTVKFWDIATGTAVPTSVNSINASGVSIATGTAVASTTLTDFTKTAVAAGDMIVMAVTAVSGTVSTVTGTLTCN